MSDIAADAAPAPARRGSRRGLLAMLGLGLAAGAAGFVPTYLGLWSPRTLLAAKAPPAAAGIGFVALPVLTVSVPGPRPRQVRVAIVLEVDERHRGTVEHLVPRVVDTATTFLTGIAPEAYDRRGILEIVRAELATRAAQVLGENRIRDLLLTEFVLT